MTSNLSECLNKVGEVVTEELGTNNDAFAAVVGEIGGTHQFSFSLKTQGSSSGSVLQCDTVSTILFLSSNILDALLSYQERKLLETLGETRQRLVSCSCSCDNSQSCGRTSEIPASKLDTRSIALLVCEAAGGGSSQTTTRTRKSLRSDSLSGRTGESVSHDHLRYTHEVWTVQLA